MAARKKAATPTSEPEKDMSAIELDQDASALAPEKAATPTSEPEKGVDVLIARVIEKFRDKETGSILRPGAAVAVARPRFDELVAAGVVEEL